MFQLGKNARIFIEDFFNASLDIVQFFLVSEGFWSEAGRSVRIVGMSVGPAAVNAVRLALSFFFVEFFIENKFLVNFGISTGEKAELPCFRCL